MFFPCLVFQVNIVDPLKLTQEFSTILANQIIATNVVATMILHKELYVVWFVVLRIRMKYVVFPLNFFNFDFL